MTDDQLEETPLYRKALGCLWGGIIGDAMGTPTENMAYQDIEARFGWIADFDSDGTDDTVMKNLLSEALVRSGGYANLDDWAALWLENWQQIFGSKLAKFFVSVIHTAHKLKHHALPRMAALGNMPSSSSAMCISPVGIINACNPRQAAIQAYNLASLIHVHDVSFCQDGAAALAAATAEAFRPGATIQSVLDASTSYLERTSGREMLDRIEAALALARETGNYRAFRSAAYAQPERFFCRITCDSRETVPLTLALFHLADGDVERCVTYGANFGRDADTIASMAGATAGALRGAEGIRQEWSGKVSRWAAIDQRELARQLARAAMAKYEVEGEARAVFASITGPSQSVR
jgi:ADP-ribosylglycohydrolase